MASGCEEDWQARVLNRGCSSADDVTFTWLQHKAALFDWHLPYVLGMQWCLDKPARYTLLSGQALPLAALAAQLEGIRDQRSYHTQLEQVDNQQLKRFALCTIESA